jgi:predicted membrane protein
MSYFFKSFSKLLKIIIICLGNFQMKHYARKKRATDQVSIKPQDDGIIKIFCNMNPYCF